MNISREVNCYLKFITYYSIIFHADTILEGAATAIKALQPILVQQKGFSGPRFRRSAEEES